MLPFLLSRSTSSHTLCVFVGQAVSVDKVGMRKAAAPCVACVAEALGVHHRSACWM